MSSARLQILPYTLWEQRTGAGSPIALIHGLSGSTRWWSRNVPALAERHLVASVDLIGFGRNRRLTTPLLMPSFQEVTALLARWLKTFPQPVHLAGHSMGGLLAIRLAAERPDLVRSLVLVNAVGMPFALRFAPHLRALPKRPWGLNLAGVLLPDALRAGPASLAIASAQVLLGDSREWMRQIRVPALLVWGEADPLVPLPYAEEMQRLIHGSRLVVLPHAAHVAMWDRPEEFNRVVLDFIDEVERQPLAPPPASTLFAWGIAGWQEGIVHRQAGRRPDIVLLHGLGMSSAYFEPFARSLFRHGWQPIAPDLPGFGESVNAPGASPADHARRLSVWADALGIRDAVWVGHSLGCNIAAHIARERPDLCREAVHIGPLWTKSAAPLWRLFAMLTLDAFREPLRLYRLVMTAYWRTGIWRWCTTLWRSRHDLRAHDVPGRMIVGERDPLPDRTSVTQTTVPGAHGCHFSHPEETAAALGAPPAR
ncbi:MAG TPA: alpha/beta fold hydrolase [Thermoanaerobaculia bacterium]|nr:alpha/beta fold hydrolase [Thermoanaerobaculia bacterium]